MNNATNNVPELYIGGICVIYHIFISFDPFLIKFLKFYPKDETTDDDNYQNASFEWNEIELKTQIEKRKSSVAISEIEDELNFNQLTIDELEDYFELIDIQEQLLSINCEVKVQKKKSFHSLINRILPCKITKLKSCLQLERDRVFAIALTKFSTNEHMNFRLLITIYEILLQKKGHFKEKVDRMQEAVRAQNSMFSTISNNNLEAPSRKSSFRRFKYVKSFKLRNSFRNQGMRKHNDLVNGSVDGELGHSLQESVHNDAFENAKRNRSVDLSAFKNENNLLKSEYKYRINEQETNTDNSLDSFRTSLNSNFEYQSASAFSKFADLNSNYLNGNLNHANSGSHLSINNGLNGNYSSRFSSRQSSRQSIRSATSLSCSRKSSTASYFTERISIELIHRSIQFGDHWQDCGFQGADPTTDLR